MKSNTSRRNFIKTGAATTMGLITSPHLTQSQNYENNPSENIQEEGTQRISIKKLKEWESLKYGMFIHFGISTFLQEEIPDGQADINLYNPEKLDVDQWIRYAKQAGMKYAVLTTKHVAGHCLWPSKHTVYHVGNSRVKTDVVAEFVNACHKYGVLPGLYYCSWDNHHTFGSVTPSSYPMDFAYTTQKYRDFQLAQMEELLTNYGDIFEVWIDIPAVLLNDGRRAQYNQINELQPDAIIMMNNGWGTGQELKFARTFPTDLMAIERFLPISTGFNPWFDIRLPEVGNKKFYLPGEVCDTIGYDWFYNSKDKFRTDGSLLGMRCICEELGTNLLLNVPPGPDGRFSEETIKTLLRIEENYNKIQTK